jgi:hypothetical protein
MENQRNEYLWKKAQNRAAFKVHALMYVLVNAGLWGLYLFMSMQSWGGHITPWPIWPMLGWGIGLASHYFSAYGNMDQRKMAEAEYQKLLRDE